MHIGGKCILDFQEKPLEPAVSSGDVFLGGFDTNGQWILSEKV